MNSHTRHCSKELHQADDANIIVILILETRKLKAQRGYLKTGGKQIDPGYLAFMALLPLRFLP